MTDIKTIQSLLDERAEKRLIKDLGDMRLKITQMPLLSVTDNGFPQISTTGKDGKVYTSSPYWFFNSDNPFYKKLYEYWLPIYKEQEAKEFVTRVHDLQSQVDNLLSNQPQDY